MKGIHCRAICRPFTAPQQNISGHELEDGGEVKATVTIWLVTQGMN
jgi:hypothetical protein